MRTRIRTIRFYDRFSCAGSECRRNCCHGWLIPVDDDSVRRYKKEKGFLGIRAKLALSGAKDEVKTFNSWSMTCPMLDADGLCSLQKKRGEKFLPEVCRVFPREWSNLGSFVEKMLDTSCVRAAEVFLEAVDEENWGLDFTEETGLWEMPREGDNEDPEFLEELDGLRNDIVQRLMTADISTPADFDDMIFALADEAKLMQNRYLRTDEGGMHRIRLFPFSIMLINDLMSTCLYQDHLKWTEPEFFKLCRIYYREFDPLTEIQGQEKLENMVDDFFSAEGPGRTGWFVRYFTYSLMREFFYSYEDYSFLRRIVEAAINVNILLLFEMLHCSKGGTLTLKDRADIISIYEKRAMHNSDVMDEMVREVGKRFV